MRDPEALDPKRSIVHISSAPGGPILTGLDPKSQDRRPADNAAWARNACEEFESLTNWRVGEAFSLWISTFSMRWEMSQQNLESVLKAAGNPVQLLRNSKIGAYVYPVVPSEYTNWRDEQRAWRESAVLFDQSHHMAEFTVKGPDALKLMSYCTINSFNNFAVGKAKQMVPISYDGYVIGDGILFYEDQDELVFVGRAPTVNWLQFQAETGTFKVDTIRDDRSPSAPRGTAG